MVGMQGVGRVAIASVLALLPLSGCDPPDCPGNAVAPAVRFDFSSVAHVSHQTQIRACVEQQCRSNADLPPNYRGGTVSVAWNGLSGHSVPVSLVISRNGTRLFSGTAEVRPSQTEPYGPGCGHVWLAAVQASGTKTLEQVPLDSSGG